MMATLKFPADVSNKIGGMVNPYSPSPLVAAMLYEPLVIASGQSCEIAPWLAASCMWTGADSLSFTIRDSVKWSDSKSFTAKDVAFTFNLGKQYPGADKGGLWNDTFGAHVNSVTAEGNVVKVAFSGSAAPKFANIINTSMLPEHMYSTVGDPTKDVDANPVSIEPYKVGPYNDAGSSSPANDLGWQR